MLYKYTYSFIHSYKQRYRKYPDLYLHGAVYKDGMYYCCLTFISCTFQHMVALINHFLTYLLTYLLTYCQVCSVSVCLCVCLCVSRYLFVSCLLLPSSYRYSWASFVHRGSRPEVWWEGVWALDKARHSAATESRRLVIQQPQPALTDSSFLAVSQTALKNLIKRFTNSLRHCLTGILWLFDVIFWRRRS